MKRYRLLAKLQHIAENSDAPSVFPWFGPLEQGKCSAYRDRIGIVALIDEENAPTRRIEQRLYATTLGGPGRSHGQAGAREIGAGEFDSGKCGEAVQRHVFARNA